MISLDGSNPASQSEGGKDVDQMERFLGLVDWGNVPKPAEWVDGAYDDAEGEEEGQVEDVDELAKRIGAVDVSRI